MSDPAGDRVWRSGVGWCDVSEPVRAECQNNLAGEAARPRSWRRYRKNKGLSVCRGIEIFNVKYVSMRKGTKEAVAAHRKFAAETELVRNALVTNQSYIVSACSQHNELLTRKLKQETSCDLSSLLKQNQFSWLTLIRPAANDASRLSLNPANEVDAATKAENIYCGSQQHQQQPSNQQSESFCRANACSEHCYTLRDSACLQVIKGERRKLADRVRLSDRCCERPRAVLVMGSVGSDERIRTGLCACNKCYKARRQLNKDATTARIHVQVHERGRGSYETTSGFTGEERSRSGVSETCSDNKRFAHGAAMSRSSLVAPVELKVVARRSVSSPTPMPSQLIQQASYDEQREPSREARNRPTAVEANAEAAEVEAQALARVKSLESARQVNNHHQRHHHQVVAATEDYQHAYLVSKLKLKLKPNTATPPTTTTNHAQGFRFSINNNQNNKGNYHKAQAVAKRGENSAVLSAGTAAANNGGCLGGQRVQTNRAGGNKKRLLFGREINKRARQTPATFSEDRHPHYLSANHRGHLLIGNNESPFQIYHGSSLLNSRLTRKPPSSFHDQAKTTRFVVRHINRATQSREYFKPRPAPSAQVDARSDSRSHLATLAGLNLSNRIMARSSNQQPPTPAPNHDTRRSRPDHPAEGHLARRQSSASGSNLHPLEVVDQQTRMSISIYEPLPPRQQAHERNRSVTEPSESAHTNQDGSTRLAKCCLNDGDELELDLDESPEAQRMRELFPLELRKPIIDLNKSKGGGGGAKSKKAGGARECTCEEINSSATLGELQSGAKSRLVLVELQTDEANTCSLRLDPQWTKSELIEQVRRELVKLYGDQPARDEPPNDDLSKRPLYEEAQCAASLCLTKAKLDLEQQTRAGCRCWEPLLGPGSALKGGNSSGNRNGSLEDWSGGSSRSSCCDMNVISSDTQAEPMRDPTAMSESEQVQMAKAQSGARSRQEIDTTRAVSPATASSSSRPQLARFATATGRSNPSNGARAAIHRLHENPSNLIGSPRFERWATTSLGSSGAKGKGRARCASHSAAGLTHAEAPRQTEAGRVTFASVAAAATVGGSNVGFCGYEHRQQTRVAAEEQATLNLRHKERAQQLQSGKVKQTISSDAVAVEEKQEQREQGQSFSSSSLRDHHHHRHQHYHMESSKQVNPNPNPSPNSNAASSYATAIKSFADREARRRFDSSGPSSQVLTSAETRMPTGRCAAEESSPSAVKGGRGSNRLQQGRPDQRQQSPKNRQRHQPVKQQAEANSAPLNQATNDKQVMIAAAVDSTSQDANAAALVRHQQTNAAHVPLSYAKTVRANRGNGASLILAQDSSRQQQAPSNHANATKQQQVVMSGANSISTGNTAGHSGKTDSHLAGELNSGGGGSKLQLQGGPAPQEQAWTRAPNWRASTRQHSAAAKRSGSSSGGGATNRLQQQQRDDNYPAPPSSGRRPQVDSGSAERTAATNGSSPPAASGGNNNCTSHHTNWHQSRPRRQLSPVGQQVHTPPAAASFESSSPVAGGAESASAASNDDDRVTQVRWSTLAQHNNGRTTEAATLATAKAGRSRPAGTKAQGDSGNRAAACVATMAAGGSQVTGASEAVPEQTCIAAVGRRAAPDDRPELELELKPERDGAGTRQEGALAEQVAAAVAAAGKLSAGKLVEAQTQAQAQGDGNNGIGSVCNCDADGSEREEENSTTATIKCITNCQTSEGRSQAELLSLAAAVSVDEEKQQQVNSSNGNTDCNKSSKCTKSTTTTTGNCNTANKIGFGSKSSAAVAARAASGNSSIERNRNNSSGNTGDVSAAVSLTHISPLQTPTAAQDSSSSSYSSDNRNRSGDNIVFAFDKNNNNKGNIVEYDEAAPVTPTANLDLQQQPKQQQHQRQLQYSSELNKKSAPTIIGKQHTAAASTEEISNVAQIDVEPDNMSHNKKAHHQHDSNSSNNNTSQSNPTSAQSVKQTTKTVNCSNSNNLGNKSTQQMSTATNCALASRETMSIGTDDQAGANPLMKSPQQHQHHTGDTNHADHLGGNISLSVVEPIHESNNKSNIINNNNNNIKQIHNKNPIIVETSQKSPNHQQHMTNNERICSTNKASNVVESNGFEPTSAVGISNEHQANKLCNKFDRLTTSSSAPQEGGETLMQPNDKFDGGNKSPIMVDKSEQKSSSDAPVAPQATRLGLSNLESSSSDQSQKRPNDSSKAEMSNDNNHISTTCNLNNKEEHNPSPNNGNNTAAPALEDTIQRQSSTVDNNAANTNNINTTIQPSQQSSASSYELSQDNNQSETKQRVPLQPSANNRSILILREIDPESPESSVREIFNSENCPSKPVHCEYALHNSWYVTFKNDEDAKLALAYIRKYIVKWNGQAIMARYKPKPAVASASNQPPPHPNIVPSLVMQRQGSQDNIVTSSPIEGSSNNPLVGEAGSTSSSTVSSSAILNSAGVPAPVNPNTTNVSPYQHHHHQPNHSMLHMSHMVPHHHHHHPQQSQHHQPHPHQVAGPPHPQSQQTAAQHYGYSAVAYYGQHGPILTPWHYSNSPHYDLSEVFIYNGLTPYPASPAKQTNGANGNSNGNPSNNNPKMMTNGICSASLIGGTTGEHQMAYQPHQHQHNQNNHYQSYAHHHNHHHHSNSNNHNHHHHLNNNPLAFGASGAMGGNKSRNNGKNNSNNTSSSVNVSGNGNGVGANANNHHHHNHHGHNHQHLSNYNQSVSSSHSTSSAGSSSSQTNNNNSASANNNGAGSKRNRNLGGNRSSANKIA